MSDYQPVELHAFYRSHTHLPIWEVIEEASIWRKLGIKARFEYCDSSSVAEAALFDGRVDFVSGNHISPYGLVARGKPIVSLASPVNSKTEKIISRKPVKSLTDLRGRRIADTPMEGRDGGFHHGRGNHMMYLIRAGIGIDQVRWIEDEDSEKQLAAFKSGKADARFISANATERYKTMGFHVLPLGPLPMINGPTLTTALTALERKDRLGERMVKAMVMGIHFARTHREETERILDGLRKREPEAGAVRYESLARMPVKPYPALEAVANAYELCLMKIPEANAFSPLALWDTHYLRDLDQSGFIDGLYSGR